MSAIQQILLAEKASSTLNAKIVAWQTSLGANAVSGARATLLSTMMNSLDSASITTKLYRLFIFANENSAAALLDIINLGAATEVLAPTFTTDRGYTTSRPAGVAHYVNLGTAGASPYTLNSAHFGFWLRTNLSVEDGLEMGASTATVDYMSSVAAAWSDGNTYIGINDNTDPGRAKPTSTIGNWVLNRSTSAATQVYLSGTSIGSNTDASQAVPTTNFIIGGCLNHLGVNDQALATQTPQFAAAHLGGSLSGTDATNLYNALQTYMTAVGA